jgi:hypothetical protein
MEMNRIEYPGPLNEAEWNALCDMIETHGETAVYKAVAYFTVQEDLWNQSRKIVSLTRKR